MRGIFRKHKRVYDRHKRVYMTCSSILFLILIFEPTRPLHIPYAAFCLQKKTTLSPFLSYARVSSPLLLAALVPTPLTRLFDLCQLLVRAFVQLSSPLLSNKKKMSAEISSQALHIATRIRSSYYGWIGRR